MITPDLESRYQFFVGDFIRRTMPFLEKMVDYDKIVIDTLGGFGHQFSGPDITRRMFNDKKCLFICLEWPGRHNPFTPLIWSDIRVLSIPILTSDHFALAGAGPEPAALHEIASRNLEALSRMIESFKGERPTNLVSLMEEMADLEPDWQDSARSRAAYIEYFSLLRSTTRKKRRLPDPLREEIINFIRQTSGIDLHRQAFFCLYLRQKFGPTDSAIRSGSSPQDYVPALRRLFAAGYSGFVVGDYIIRGMIDHAAVWAERAVACSWGKKLLDLVEMQDPENAQLSWRGLRPDIALQRIFELFFLSDCALFIGESGGASQLPPFDGIPSLIVNAVPTVQAWPNAAILYKPMEHEDGSLVHYRQLLTTFRFAYESDEARFRCNTAEELQDAVDILLANLPAHPFGYGAAAIQGLPKDMHLHHCDAVISPAFFRIYHGR
jgi:hypothetical protein